MMTSFRNPWFVRGAVVAVIAIAAFSAWKALRPKDLADGFASGNGRIEAVEIDVATKTAGRIKEILANEGDFVQAGQILARMDTDALEAQLREAQARQRSAVVAIRAAQSLVEQRKAQQDAARAVARQQAAALDNAKRRLARSEPLAAQGTISAQKLDDDRAQFQGAQAAAGAAQAQVTAAEAALGTARSQVEATQSDAAALQATVERIQADIQDSVLRSPRDGRVQYRVAQPGEVVGAGGRVLNLIDLGDVYMTFFLPTAVAGRLALGSEVHLVLDALPQYVIPAKVSFVADVAQFTPKTVETAEERQKLVFRVKARIDPDLLRKHITQVKTGLPGMAYVRVEDTTEWPARLQIRLPQ